MKEGVRWHINGEEQIVTPFSMALLRWRTLKYEVMDNLLQTQVFCGEVREGRRYWSWQLKA